MTPEMMKWALGAMGACTVTVLGAVVWLATLVFRVGQKYGSVETSLEAIKAAADAMQHAHERLDRIPIIEMKVEGLAESISEERRRFASLIPQMQEKLTTLWERVFSLQTWRKSQGHYGNGNGNGE